MHHQVDKLNTGSTEEKLRVVEVLGEFFLGAFCLQLPGCTAIVFTMLGLRLSSRPARFCSGALLNELLVKGRVRSKANVQLAEVRLGSSDFTLQEW